MKTVKGIYAEAKIFIAVRKKRVVEGKVQQIVELPEAIQTEKDGRKQQDTSST